MLVKLRTVEAMWRWGLKVKMVLFSRVADEQRMSLSFMCQTGFNADLNSHRWEVLRCLFSLKRKQKQKNPCSNLFNLEKLENVTL